MAVDTFLKCQPHEGDLHLIFDDCGLGPYYAMDSIRKDHDKWQTEGKPTRSMKWQGKKWALAYDYDNDNPLDPWTADEYQLQSVPEFRFYFVRKDVLYEGEQADQSQRVCGGTVTVRPRWPGMTADGDRVKGIPDLGDPYIDVQIQASNIDHEDYHELTQGIFAAFDLNNRYFQTPHEVSNWNEMAVYVRGRRGETGQIYAADGPIARMHGLLQPDRSGYREHTENHSKLPGYMVKSKIDSGRSRDLITGHKLGKEIKHYYPKNPIGREPDDPLYHPKIEVALQSSITEETVYWEDTEDAVRELEETLLNIIEWADMPLKGSNVWRPDAYFSGDDGEQRQRKLVECPLPEIEDQQEQAVMSLWGNMTAADRSVTELLLTDGGEISPQDAADETGYSYRTIRRVVDRCEEIIEHTYGELALGSKHQRQMLLDRLHAAEQGFKDAMEEAVLTVADEVQGVKRDRWTKIKRKYNLQIVDDRDEYQQLIKVGYEAPSRPKAKRIIREIKNAYRQVAGSATGVVARINIVGQGQESYQNLETGKLYGVRAGSDTHHDIGQPQSGGEGSIKSDW